MAAVDDRLLLHACCGPCASVALPDWRDAGCTVTTLFFNPNIEPAAEYSRRLESMRMLAGALDAPLIVVEAGEAGEETQRAFEAWRDAGDAVGPADHEARCRLCTVVRLFESARQAAQHGFPRFATTLSVSPYQMHDAIEEAGLMAGATFGVEYLYRDQRPLFRRQFEESRRLGLYRQPYCGCVLSKWEAWHRKRVRRAPAP
ncbi:MAG: epoxyqueuosine reductase QueH [Actinobacteria bacterium]|nr:epoxyqueuosine reductase QueH [Actinomycetota bacterium]